jgi:hypothetical protein
VVAAALTTVDQIMFSLFAILLAIIAVTPMEMTRATGSRNSHNSHNAALFIVMVRPLFVYYVVVDYIPSSLTSSQIIPMIRESRGQANRHWESL